MGAAANHVRIHDLTPLLADGAAHRGTEVLREVASHGLPCALTGGLALTAHLRAHRRAVERHPLHDIDLVVPAFESIPASLASAFVLNHVHPHAPEGKTLLQLIDERNRVRVDLFRAFGDTMARTVVLKETGMLPVVSLEDLRARTVAMLRTQLERGRPIDVKHAAACRALDGLGNPGRLEVAWRDHREQLTGTFNDSVAAVEELIQTRQELLVVEKYSREVTPCARCRTCGPFSPAPPQRIVGILGYW